MICWRFAKKLIATSVCHHHLSTPLGNGKHLTSVASMASSQLHGELSAASGHFFYARRRSRDDDEELGEATPVSSSSSM